ncbi:pepsin-like aspartyl protease [Chitinophaga japonensis]|uniref:pepsin-like aspartyl protease n=1 Tax=Chitinophaga japonensis TaxID=104662 RepID=UPI0011AA66E7|nr:pepsin-like aspartyl protease [Chitinophaga japonensis]
METLQSCQFVELSRSELMNVSGGGEYDVLCGLISILPDVEISLGGQTFELTPTDYVLKVTDEGVSPCISGFMGIDISVFSGPLWRMG